MKEHEEHVDHERPEPEPEPEVAVEDAVEDDEGEGEGPRVNRWAGPLLVIGGPLVLVMAVVAWLFSGDLLASNHPFDDARACAGSQAPLDQALRSTGVVLPPDAADVHYYTWLDDDGRLSYSVSFRVSSLTARSLLSGDGPDGIDLRDLGDSTGDVSTGDPNVPQGLCGSLPQTSYFTAPFLAGDGGLSPSGSNVPDQTISVQMAPEVSEIADQPYVVLTR